MLSFFIKSQPALLIIVWDYFYVCSSDFVRSFAATNYDELNDDTYNIVFDIGYCLIYFLFPLFGLLADVIVGRYTSIITGVYILYIGFH